MLSPVLVLNMKWWEILILVSAVIASGLTFFGNLQRIYTWLFGKCKQVIAVFITPTKIVTIEANFSDLQLQLNKMAKAVEAVTIIAETQAAQQTRLNFIYEQMVTNGGNSLRDAVNKLLRNQSTSNELRRRLIESTGVAFWESDAEGKAIFLSNHLLELTGLTAEEAAGWGWASSVHDDDRERISKEWETAVQYKRRFHERYRFVHKDGTVVHIEANSNPLLENDIVVGYVGIVKEIKNELPSTTK